MRVAFKDWAVVVDALGRGQQILILRKGGISEGRRGFQVEHAEFLLYPSLHHQERASVVEYAQTQLDELVPTLPPAGRVRLEFYAHVVSWRRLEALESVHRLQGQHIWTDAVLAERFEWGKDKNIHALAVRVFRLAKAVELPIVPSYGGCKSWIELEEDVNTNEGVPVLSKEVFNEKLDQFHLALDYADAEKGGADGIDPV